MPKPLILLTGHDGHPTPHFATDLEYHKYPFKICYSLKELVALSSKDYSAVFYIRQVNDDVKNEENLRDMVLAGKVKIPIVNFMCNMYNRPKTWVQSKYFILWWFESLLKENLKKAGNWNNCYYSGFGCSPTMFYKKNIKKDIDFGNVGRLYKQRAHLLDVLKGKIRFDGKVSFDEMNTLFNRTKVNLRVSCDAMSPIGVDLKMGIFEVTMSGNFCLSQWTPEIEENFIITGNKKEMDTWRTKKELLEKANYYLAHDNEREEIAKRGHDKCRNNYTWTDRIKKVLAFVESRSAI